MRDDQYGRAAAQRAHAGTDRFLALRIERTGRFVEQQQSRLLACSARAIARRCRWPPDRPTPPSPTRVATPVGKRVDELSAPGRVAAHRRIVPHRRVGRAVAQVVEHAAGEQHRVLRHEPDLTAQARERTAPQIDAIDEDAPAGRIVEALRQIEQRRLAGAGGSDQRDHLARVDARKPHPQYGDGGRAG